MNMIIKQKIVLTKLIILLIGLILTITFSGCLDTKVSAAEELNTSFLLINDAELNLENTRFDKENYTYSELRVKLEASRVNFEEALKILKNTSSDYQDENELIKRNIIFAEVGLDRINCSENIITMLEHLDKSVAYAHLGEFNSSREELNKSNKALNNSILYLGSAKEKISSINPDSVPVQHKSYVITIKNSLETAEKMSLEFGYMINGIYPFIDGYEHLINANEYVKSNEWDKAANECNNSFVDFSESKGALEKLENSKYVEISVEAIEMCAQLKQIEENLPHLEAGCRFMDTGQYYKAQDEFAKVNSI